MDENSFDRERLSAKQIGFGLAALGRPGYINLGHDQDLGADKSVEALETRALRMLDAAWEAGIRYYDAARSYGRAEAFLSSWLQTCGIRAEDITIGSKWGYTYTANWQVRAKQHEIKEHSNSVLLRQFQESRELLGEHLKLYQIHSATLESGVLENTDVLKALAELKSGGLMIGLTLSGDQQSETLKRAMTIEEGGKLLFNAVQATWNLLEPSAGKALGEAHDLGICVIVKEALANGRLTSRNEDDDIQEEQKTLNEVAEEKGVAVDAVALAAALAQPWADVVLSGAAQREHLESNLKAQEIELSEGQLERLGRIAEPSRVYWEKRARLAWN